MYQLANFLFSLWIDKLATCMLISTLPQSIYGSSKSPRSPLEVILKTPFVASPLLV